MSDADHTAMVANFIRLLDSANEPEAQVALGKLRAYCAKHHFALTSLQFGNAPARIELTVASPDDSVRRMVGIIEEQQTRTQAYCAWLEKQVDDLTQRLAEAEARPRRKRKKPKAA